MNCRLLQLKLLDTYSINLEMGCQKADEVKAETIANSTINVEQRKNVEDPVKVNEQQLVPKTVNSDSSLSPRIIDGDCTATIRNENFEENQQQAVVAPMIFEQSKSQVATEFINLNFALNSIQSTPNLSPTRNSEKENAADNATKISEHTSKQCSFSPAKVLEDVVNSCKSSLNNILNKSRLNLCESGKLDTVKEKAKDLTQEFDKTDDGKIFIKDYHHNVKCDNNLDGDTIIANKYFLDVDMEKNFQSSGTFAFLIN